MTRTHPLTSTHPPKNPFRWIALVTAGLLAASGATLPSLVGGVQAHAAESSAPVPIEYRVVDTEHADIVAAFWDDGELTLGAQANVDERLGVRFAPDQLLIHVNDLARVDSWGAGREFVAPEGSTVWVAPMAQKPGVVWPGFSTDSVPSGVLDGEITLTLDKVDGPGDVEVWQSGSEGGSERLWSSDEQIKSFSRPTGTHLHANWAFTRPGLYHLTVTASASAGGNPVTDTQTYTFVAGPLPEQIATTTALQIVGGSTVPVGSRVTVRATTTPASADGYLEFREGAVVLGHAEVVGGTAEFEIDDLGTGTHSITAHFVPRIANFAAGSSATPVVVNVTDSSGSLFEVSGVEESYLPGETLEVRAIGATLSEGQSFDWTIRPIGTAWDPFPMGIDTGSTYSHPLTASENGYEISAAIVENWSVVSRTGWVPIRVAELSTAPTISLLGDSSLVHTGSEASFRWEGAELAADDTVEWVYRFSGGLWNRAGSGYPYPLTEQAEAKSASVRSELCAGATEFGLRVLRDGLPIAQSEPVAVEFVNREVHFDGYRPAYREGSTLRVEPRLYPAVADLSYTWEQWTPSERRWSTVSETTSPVLERTLSMEDNGTYWRLSARKNGIDYIGSGNLFSVTVSDTPADQTMMVMDALSAHYHQGDRISLNLNIDPAPADDDTIAWEWQWPGEEWAQLPGVTGSTGALTAEQALNGVNIRATLTFADAGADAKPISVGATIHVDDHGAAPRQQLSVAEPTSARAGDTVTLSRELPQNGGTVLTAHRWEKQLAGSERWTSIEGQSGAELSFTAALADDGAQYRVSLLTPSGAIAYGPSAAVTLGVEAASDPLPNTPEPNAPIDQLPPSTGNESKPASRETSEATESALSRTGAGAGLLLPLAGGSATLLLAGASLLAFGANRRRAGGAR